jgi:hypothetical protein
LGRKIAVTAVAAGIVTAIPLFGLTEAASASGDSSPHGSSAGGSAAQLPATHAQQNGPTYLVLVRA